MENQDFITTIKVDRTPKEVFEAVTNVRSWWSEEIEGDTANQGAEFYYHFQDVHRCTMKLTEVIPDQKVVWEVLDNYFNFTADKTEWIGNTISFDITPVDNQTLLTFTHHGLLPQYECYDICAKCWTDYITGSLYDLITKGQGQPNPKESETVQE